MSPTGSGVPDRVSYPELYHATRPESAKVIERSGFHGKSKVETGEGYGGAVFGAGTYLHTDKNHADQYLKGMHDYENGDEVQIPARADIKQPLVVNVRAGEGNETSDFEAALRRAGALKAGEHYNDSKFGRRPGDIGGAEATRRLQVLGYDAVEVRQSQFDVYAGGSQLVVFDPKKVAHGHGKARA